MAKALPKGRKRLTTKSIAALTENGTRYDVWDAIVPGLAVRVTERGHKSFVLMARFPGGKNPTRRRLAKVGSLTLEGARDRARKWLSQIEVGVDPKVELERAQQAAANRPETFRSVAERFVEQHVRRNKLRSGSETERILNRELYPKWQDREFASIRRGEVAQLLDKIEARAPVMADRVLSVLSKLCNWYQARQEDYVSPIVRGMRRTKPSERARDRILSDDEIRAIWAAAGKSDTFGAFVKIALLTAQRRAKVAEMKWQDIGPDGTWTIPSESREKANAARLKLPPVALTIIRAQKRRADNPYVFAGRLGGPINGFTKAKRALDALLNKDGDAAIAPWTIHDLRRTARSLMSRARVAPHISERVLGHAISGVEGVYDRHAYDREKAGALKKLAELVERIVATKPSETVSLELAAPA